MLYSIGDIIVSKKPHACGGNEWEVIRVGADVKLKCKTCGRSVFMSYDQVKNVAKSYTVKTADGEK